MPIRERIEDQTVEPQIAEVMRHASRTARDVLRLNADPDDADPPRLLKKYIDRASAWAREASAPGLYGVAAAVVLVILTNTILVGLRNIQELPPVSITFLLVILIAAIRWGMLAGTVTAIGGIISFTSFFYSPFYTYDPQDRSRFLSILFFLIAGVVTSYIAARTRRTAAVAIKRENEIRELYAFSQRLSATNSPAGIFDAMQRHLETLVGRKILLFDSRGTLDDKSERRNDIDIPKAVTESVGRTQAPGPEGSKGIVVEDGRGSAWLVRRVSVNTADFGVIAVDLGRKANRFNDLRTRVVAVINDAASSLERLGLARTIADARMRTKTEEFREALIGSVSHEFAHPTGLDPRRLDGAVGRARNHRQCAAGVPRRRDSSRVRAPQCGNPEYPGRFPHHQRRPAGEARMGGAGGLRQFGIGALPPPPCQAHRRDQYAG
jgi:K+-sensing histidine kinase KdpD